jgi:hypothetical protein
MIRNYLIPLGEGGRGIDTNYSSSQSPLPSSPRGKLLRSKGGALIQNLTPLPPRRGKGGFNPTEKLPVVIHFKIMSNVA